MLHQTGFLFTSASIAVFIYSDFLARVFGGILAAPPRAAQELCVCGGGGELLGRKGKEEEKEILKRDWYTGPHEVEKGRDAAREREKAANKC